MSFQRPFPSSSRWKYDVFLSFRGEDTRKGFTDHLYTALESHGITTFRDDTKLKKGKSISPELSTAIEESRFGLVVLSRNYASSTWCLDELLKILECMETRESVLPIFYDVNPSDARKQTGSFAEAFTKHDMYRDDKDKVQRWRCGLTKLANISGWISTDRHESKLIDEIVEVIWAKLRPSFMLNSIEYFVGIESQFNKLRFLLCSSVGDVRFVGIWGMGGIGKTTLARAFYNSMSHEYEFKTFLHSVRSLSDGMNGLCQLQKKLLPGLATIQNDIWDPLEGVAIIRNFLRNKKVLLILDDVNSLDQLEYLAGNKQWFGSGSRIVITTRDEHLLIAHGVHRRFKVEVLANSEALKLFSLKAFKKDYPPDDYLGLSKCVVEYAKGLPLAVKVLGSFLHGRSLSVWNSALGKLSEVFNSEILEILKISYDGLRDNEKNIFLDIACFFNGKQKDQVIKTLDNFGNDATIGIDVLVERSLLTVSYGQISMHDLLQEMGREIVHRESPDEPGGRSRLWHWEDVNHVLSKNTGTAAIKGILLNPAKSRIVMHVNASAKSLLMMSKLRVLIVNYVNLANGLECFPDDLRVIKWTAYPLKYFPQHFNPEKLLELNMSHSHIEHFWTGIKALYQLRSINLSHSLNLIDTPDFRDIPYLESLILEGCIQLYRVHSSLGMLERLAEINLKNCTNLVHFPSSVRGLKSLKVLDVSGCLKLCKLPDDLGHAECLEELDVSGTAIREPPSSFGLLNNLKVLSCRGCKPASPRPWYKHLPFGLSLERTQRSRDPSPKFWNMIPFRLSLARTPEPTSWSLLSFSSFPSLVKLDLSDCNLYEGAIPNDISCMSSLKKLNLSRNHFVSLPNSISYLSKLEDLNLENCEMLQTMPELPSQVELNACNCLSLERWSIPIERCKLLLSANLTNCFKLGKQCCRTLALTLIKRYLEGIPYLYRLENGLRFVVPGNEIPDWFNHQSVGSSVSVDVHPGFSSMYMGFAVCAVFEMKGLARDRKRKHGRSLGSSHTLDQAVSDHLWFEYAPRHIYYEDQRIQSWQNSRQINFFFGPGAQVKKCGVRIVYEPEIRILNESLKNCNFGTSPDALKFSGKAAAVSTPYALEFSGKAVSSGRSTKCSTLEHHDEAAPSGSGYHGLETAPSGSGYHGFEAAPSGSGSLCEITSMRRKKKAYRGLVSDNLDIERSWDDSLGMSPEQTNCRGRLHLPSSKRIAVSPLKKYEDKRLFKRRKVNKRWSLQEEETLRTGVQKYGKGNWKIILDAYRDMFEERTEVDIKDKWRNLTK